jgi:hypothetical protein
MLSKMKGKQNREKRVLVERIIRNRKNACDEKGMENTCG